MKKRFVCAILAVSMIGMLMTGCGSESSDTSLRKSARSASKRTEAEYKEEPAEEPVQASAQEPTREAGVNSAKEVSDMPDVCMEDCAEYEHYNDFSNEKYNSINENGYMSAKTSPLSTFAADVDTASYSNFRRFVTAGYGLNDFPADALRTEEMVNYFTYDYEDPRGEIFGVNAEISDCPWNEDAKLMMLGINTAELNSRNVPNSNIVFLVDVSGSMYDSNKLPLIQQSMELLMDSFDEDDRISIVTYAGDVSVVLNGERGNNKRKIMRAFNKLEAGGSTNGGDGIVLAYEVARDNFIEDGVNRVIICTDGDFNVGLTSQAELEDLISEEKESGVFLSVLGFGMYNYSDANMETLADKGNGNYAYIDTLSEAKKVLVDEMTSTFVTAAKDVKFQVEFNPALVSEYRLVGYENRTMAAEDFTDDTKDGGEMGAGHQVTAIYEIFLANEADKALSNLKYQDTTVSKKGAQADEYCTLSIAYKEPDGQKSKYLEFPIGRENYTKRPSDNYIFATSVAELSLALRNSEYLKIDNMSALYEAGERANMVKNPDSYQEEFIELIEEIADNDSYVEDYVIE